jgi:hypothetical protein
MATNNTKEKLFADLDKHRRGLVEEYYKLLNSPSLPTDDDADKRIDSIWEEAQTDSVLCKRLELVDDLCNDPAEEVTENNNDIRAYWAEYKVIQLQSRLDQEDGRVSVSAPKGEGSTWLVECPDGENLSTITLPSDTPQIMQQLKDKVCSHCQTPYEEHRWKSLAKSANQD